MRTSFFIFFYLTLTSLIGQSKMIEIRGRVSVYDKPHQPVYCFKARLSFNDTLVFETRCDTNGNYNFLISENLLRNFATKVLVFQDNRLIDKEFPPSLECPYVYSGPKRYMTPGATKLTYKANIGIFEADFNLNSNVCFYPRPLCFSFKKNSVELQTCDNLNGDTTINCIRLMLTQNPSIVIKVVGHAWEEKNATSLAKKRADYIRKKLVESGIDSVRVLSEGSGDKKPFVTKKEIIGGGYTESDNQKILSRNRRVEYIIVAFDYDPKLKRRVEIDTSIKTDADDE